MNNLIYLLSFSIPLSAFLSFYYFENFSWTTVAFVFGLLPLLELLLKPIAKNVEDKNHIIFDYILYLQVPIQYGLLIFFLNTLTTTEISTMSIVGCVFSMGICCGVIGINVAHELGHRRSKFDIFMAKSLLVSSLYYQFYIDHNKGHHKHVSTPGDPASAGKNEISYLFWVKSIYGTFFSALKIDKKDMLTGLFIQSILLGLIYFNYGAIGMAYFIASATLGAVLLESVNYIEHYGLRRKVMSSGRFEKVNPAHSWNSDHPIGRGILFNLSRHSDHHANINRKYQNLRSLEQSPQMPTGYPGMILLSLIPPLWFKIMNPKIQSE